MFCSPHVTTLRERISIDGKAISEASFDGLISKSEAGLVRARDEEGSALSHFEVMTALAFKYFQDQQVMLSAMQYSPSLTRELLKSRSCLLGLPLLSATIMSAVSWSSSA